MHAPFWGVEKGCLSAPPDVGALPGTASQSMGVPLYPFSRASYFLTHGSWLGGKQRIGGVSLGVVCLSRAVVRGLRPGLEKEEKEWRRGMGRGKEGAVCPPRGECDFQAPWDHSRDLTHGRGYTLF